MLKRTIKPAAFVSRSTFATYSRISPIHHRNASARDIFEKNMELLFKIRRLFGGKLVIRQVLKIPKAIQDFNEGFKEVKVGF